MRNGLRFGRRRQAKTGMKKKFVSAPKEKGYIRTYLRKGKMRNVGDCRKRKRGQ